MADLPRTDEEYDNLSDEERLEIKRALFDYFSTLLLETEFEDDENSV